MITMFWRAKDGRKFDVEAEAIQHQQRIDLKALLLEAPARHQAADIKGDMNIEFEEKFIEWLLLEPTRTAILEILHMTDQDDP